MTMVRQHYRHTRLTQLVQYYLVKTAQWLNIAQ